MNQEIVNFLTDNKFLVQVSIDGTEEVTNANRFDINKKGAYSRIIQGAKILQDKVIVGARGTITPIGLNVSENTKHLLEEGVAYVHLAPANNKLNKKEIEELLNYYDQYCTDFETLLKDKKYRDCILRHNLYSILREIHEGGIRNIYCAAGLKAVSVDIMGDIYPCHRFVGNVNFSMGNVVMKTFSRDSVYEQLSKIPEKCNNCICQAVCLGGCLHDNFITMKDINVPAPSNCNLQVFLTMRALKIYVSLLEEEKKCLFGKV